eukprot:CAMPEP_0171630460 /NCGR_PEP_ID=MMETSP0990-20121206/22949_1 /TAXON_ID=483369 /ORGANISM="non described non described, Strain CCMP2098" /LENGTH=206 /DNA_ID=CAMNT_0012199647 /DNA_START=92 /DNA_END=712 /DNA_ORIENTATION=-
MPRSLIFRPKGLFVTQRLRHRPQNLTAVVGLSFFSHSSNLDPVLSAHSLLELPDLFTAKELKASYFRQCKLLHPDQSKYEKEVATKLFLKLTDAYDLLKDCVSKFDGKEEAESRGEEWDEEEDGTMSKGEDEEYRLSCDLWLSTSAELIEECKADVKFRMWLLGNSDAALHWRCFLFTHGGLIPKKLRTASAALGSGGKKIRRKRK